jgi:hypothetical protein
MENVVAVGLEVFLACLGAAPYTPATRHADTVKIRRNALRLYP